MGPAVSPKHWEKTKQEKLLLLSILISWETQIPVIHEDVKVFSSM